MPDEKNPSLFRVMLANDETRRAQVDAAGEAAGDVHVEKILATSASSEEAADRIALAAFAVREHQRRSIVGAVKTHVRAQADAIKKEDPRKVRAITDQSVAEELARKE